MKTNEWIKCLYSKVTKDAYKKLLEMEVISEHNDTFYPYFNEFIVMLKNEKYVIRVRGFGIICRQTQWDKGNKMNEFAEDILAALRNEKPTAVRQAPQYLEYVVIHKKELKVRIKEAALTIDYSKFKDTMRPLIAKDIQNLVRLVDSK